MKQAPKNYRAYALSFAPGVRRRLDEMREAIAAAIPDASETISYGIPAFAIEGKKIVWFAAFKKHVGFYPGSAAVAEFEGELTRYKTAKGSVQFPYDLPVPRALVVRMTKHAAKVRKP
jgi:uncharacterized protein YdhG (YjbR/CyaY superfamily)